MACPRAGDAKTSLDGGRLEMRDRHPHSIWSYLLHLAFNQTSSHTFWRQRSSFSRLLSCKPIRNWSSFCFPLRKVGIPDRRYRQASIARLRTNRGLLIKPKRNYMYFCRMTVDASVMESPTQFSLVPVSKFGTIIEQRKSAWCRHLTF